MSIAEIRCDIGGNYEYDHNNQPVYQEPCRDTPTHRYRTAGQTAERWGHRCAPHAAWLDRTACDVETLAVTR